MDKISPEEKIKRRRQRYRHFLKSVNCCPLCSSPLILIHEVNREDQQIKETAQCDQCHIETRRKNHSCH